MCLEGAAEGAGEDLPTGIRLLPIHPALDSVATRHDLAEAHGAGYDRDEADGEDDD